MIQLIADIHNQEDVKKLLATSERLNIGWIVLEGDVEKEDIETIERHCRDKGIILTVKDNVELLRERRLHGIQLTKNFDSISVLRDELGGHPIVGLQVALDFPVTSVLHHDIDYISVEIGEDLKQGIEFAEKWSGVINIPIVASIKKLTKDTSDRLLEAGFKGFAIKGSTL